MKFKLSSLKFTLGRQKRLAYSWLIGALLIAMVFSYLFLTLNNSYIEGLQTEGSNVVPDELFMTYLQTILFFSFFTIVSVIIFIQILNDEFDLSLILIHIYILIILFDTINGINVADTPAKRLLSTVNGLLYEVSVIPLVLFITLKMKYHRKKMLVLLLLEVIAGLLYIIGSSSPSSSILSILKNISCSLVFIVVCISLYIFVILECKKKNWMLRKYFKALVLTISGFVFVLIFSMVLRNNYYIDVVTSLKNAIFGYDLLGLRKTVIQNVMIVSVVINFVTEYYTEYLEKKDNEKLVILEAEQSKSYSETVKSRIQDIRKIKHDMSDHLGVMQRLCDSEEYDRLSSYISEIRGEISELKPLSYSDNTIIDYVLVNFSESAKNKGIRYEARAIVGADVGISDGEVCSLVSNLIKNAIEGCERITDGDKFISFTMIRSGNKISIECSNSCLESAVILDGKGNPVTVKKDRSSHGFGTAIIRTICEKHHGAVSFDCEKSVFTAKAVVPIAKP